MLWRLRKLEITIFFTDGLKAYTKLIPDYILVQSKAETHGVERNNFRQRHWFGRFRRRTCIVSRSWQMVDLTMSLFAKFHVNGGFAQLLEMFGSQH
jgi:insertion element IS1 protein InsB